MTTPVLHRFGALCSPPYPLIFQEPRQRPRGCAREIIVEAATVEEALNRIILEEGWERYDPTGANWFCPACAEARRAIADGLHHLPPKGPS